MDTELLLVIADAIAATAQDYDIEIGPRGMVALSANVHNSVVDHLDNEAFDPDPKPVSNAYAAGYERGFDLSQQSPLEVFDAGRQFADNSHSDPAVDDCEFEAGFRAGLYGLETAVIPWGDE